MSGASRVRLAEPDDAPSVALLLHDFNREFGEPLPEAGELGRHLRGPLEGDASSDARTDPRSRAYRASE
jgi:hypothetical protein